MEHWPFEKKWNPLEIIQVKFDWKFGFALKFCARGDPKPLVKLLLASYVCNKLANTLERHQRTGYSDSHAKSRLLKHPIYSEMLGLFLV